LGNGGNGSNGARDDWSVAVNRRSDARALVLLVGVWALVVGLVGLGGDFALNDDWAYAFTARHLLRTGQLRILDWAAPSLATHALWGAGVLGLFGDSYVVLRCGTLVWALSALFSTYGLARTAFPPRTAILVPLALAVSPWFVNLSFTYMTDVPWLALILAALLAFAHGLHPRAEEPPRAGLLALSGALLGAAATTRQIAIVTVPAFALALAFDARRRCGRGWLWPAVRSCLCFGVPAGLVFFPFYDWYTHVHGATQATRETVEKIRKVRPWFSYLLTLSVLHYAGLWLFPLALALFLKRRLGEAVTRGQALWAFALLGSFAVLRPILGPVLDPGNAKHFDHSGAAYHPLMPYLGNVFYLVGLGPPTVTDIYRDGDAPPLHAGLWLGVLLTVLSTAGGVVAAGFLVKALRRIRRAWSVDLRNTRERSATPDRSGATDDGEGQDHRRAMLRVLLLSFMGAYLLFQLCTSNSMFDRYILPFLPIVFWLGLDGAPRNLARAPVLACFLVSGIVSVAGTHEYLSWEGARDRAVRALLARGTPATDIDGGFEVNGPVFFEASRKRTGELLGENPYFWVQNARYQISMSPDRHPDCHAEARYPYWTWPGGGDPAVYVLDCGGGASPGGPAGN